MQLLDTIKKTFSIEGKNKGEANSDTLWTTPWEWKDEEGGYIGHNGQYWLYYALPVNPLEWEDASVKLREGSKIAALLTALGATSSTPIGSIRQLSKNREIQLLSLSWDEEAKPPKGTPEKLAEYQKAALGFLIPKRALFIGVRLRATGNASSKGGVVGQLTTAATKVLGEDVPDRAAYNDDRERISTLLKRYAARPVTEDQADQLESWYNLGRGPDVTLVDEVTSLRVSDFDTLEMSAVMKFGNPIMEAPGSPWILDAMTHPDGPRAISVRAELEPASVAKARARTAQRRVNASMEEEQATGDLERVELSSTFQQAQAFEKFMNESKEPILTNCSIIMARSVSENDETYLDWLRDNYSIEMKPLEHRQIRALDEILPCSSRRINPFLQDVTISMLAYAGFNGFSNIGDPKGAFLGLADPDLTTVYIDPSAAPNNNKPPTMVIAGDPGSGKTFASQGLALQAVLEGRTCIFINPKGFDTLASFARLVEQFGFESRIVKLSALEGKAGSFDPFLYTHPEIAAEIAGQHILSVLKFEQSDRLDLQDGLKKAGKAGATYVGEALTYVNNPNVVKQIIQQVNGSSLFALGIALEPRDRFGARSGLTLIEFDREIGLPEPSKKPSDHEDNEKIALAAIRLIIRASLEILMQAKGGVMVVDEAWTFLGHETGKAALQRIGREGRSLGLLPIFATQRLSDVIDQDMESYISRVLVMQMADEKEIRASLKLCGLKATPARIAWVKECGFKKGNPELGIPDQLPSGLHRDIYNRHSAVILGPTPDAARIAFTTNPEERAARDEAERLAALNLDNPTQ